ncbi:hypothetical protein [Butyrivibrio sp. YAB3001]|uniref:hypothetical protein n=1 Tax=Butyrivibrio sp. YAB3001 TaxID=1520812 RepID=UPI0008F617B2|nr:hypothetical protein [Butyrivibrio sp. YAB3001]SFC47942.1 hypothetical protein SAMN02910398_02350 [Butyrivibrio sp. YAB3001]
MFEPFFLIPFIFVAGVWGFFLLNFAGNNRRFLKDDLIYKNEKQVKDAKSSMRIIHLMAPVWFIVVAAVILFLVNAYHPFIRFSVVGAALIAGGVFFTYLGWALGMIFKGTKDAPGDKDAKFFSRAFMISFMSSGLILVAFGIMICMSPFA